MRPITMSKQANHFLFVYLPNCGNSRLLSGSLRNRSQPRRNIQIKRL